MVEHGVVEGSGGVRWDQGWGFGGITGSCGEITGVSEPGYVTEAECFTLTPGYIVYLFIRLLFYAVHTGWPLPLSLEKIGQCSRDTLIGPPFLQAYGLRGIQHEPDLN